MLVAGGAELKYARIPTLEEEQARDWVRGRDDVRRELMRHRQHVEALLLRRGTAWPEGRTPWTEEHMRWLGRQDLGSVSAQVVYDDALGQVIQTRSRLAGLDKRIEQAAHGSSFAPVVRALECLRGVSTLTGFALAVEVGDWDRFATARGLTAFVGLVPSEHSSGQTRIQGPMTKTGNSHARRLLVEAAWHHSRPFNPKSVTLLRRQAAQPDPAVRAAADKANRRLAARWAALKARKKKPVVANGAVARELACFCWELALMAG
jgi:transposase